MTAAATSPCFLLMAKKGIKIQDLAKQLGVTSRQLVDRCREKGLAVQNSVTKLNSQSERQVRAWFTVSPTDSKEDGAVDMEDH